MVDFNFKLPKAFTESGKVLRTIAVEKTGSGWTVNGHRLTDECADHAVAFAIRQRLSNSFASAGTLKDADGKLLPESDRLAKWAEMYDAVLEKLTSPKYLPSWQTVFTGGEGSESLDPVTKELFGMAATKLRAIAKKQGKELPKMNTDQYRTLRDKYLEKNDATLRPLAEKIVADRDGIEIDDEDFEI